MDVCSFSLAISLSSPYREERERANAIDYIREENKPRGKISLRQNPPARARGIIYIYTSYVTKNFPHCRGGCNSFFALKGPRELFGRKMRARGALNVTLPSHDPLAKSCCRAISRSAIIFHIYISSALLGAYYDRGAANCEYVVALNGI